MKRINLLLSIATVIACTCTIGCNKSKSAENTGNQNGKGPSGSAAADSTGPVEMKFHWQVGKEYDEEMNMTQKAHLDVPGLGKPMDQEMKISEEFSLTGLKAMPDGGIEMEMKFIAQKMSSSMNGQAMMNFDSTLPSSMQDTNNPLAAMFSKLRDARLKYVLDANGKLVRLENADAFLKQVSGDNPQSAAAMKSLLSEENLRQMITHGQEALPTKPVKVGDSWPVVMELSGGQLGAMKLDMHYTFKGWDQHDGHRCALMDFTGKIEANPSPTNAMNLKVENGKIDGKVWYDPAMGMVINTESLQGMDMKMSVQGKDVTSHMQQQSSTRLVKVTDAH